MNRNKLGMGVLLLAASLQAGIAFAGEAATMSKADALRAEPFRDAKAVKALALGDKLDIVSKQGGWFKVKVGKSKGWVPMLSVRKGDTKKGGSAASGLLALNAGRAGTGKVVATTGVRGLNEEELKAASFNEAEMARADSYVSNKADAKKFAAQGKLVARSFDYLPAAK